MEVHENDYLEHYGVKGMRWGVQRDRQQARFGGRRTKKTGSSSSSSSESQAKRKTARFGGRRKVKRPEKLEISDKDTKTTQRVKKDYNEMGNKEFFQRYGATKSTYAKRVAKRGDPYRHRMSTRSGKLSSKYENRIGGTNDNKVAAGVLAAYVGINAAAYFSTPQGQESLKRGAAQAGKLYRKAKDVIDPSVDTLLKRGGNLMINDIPNDVLDVGLSTWPKLGS